MHFRLHQIIAKDIFAYRVIDLATDYLRTGVGIEQIWPSRRWANALVSRRLGAVLSCAAGAVICQSNADHPVVRLLCRHQIQ